MQLNNHTNNKNKISFGSKKILPVFVRNMHEMPVNAWFTRLRLSDPNDVATMEKIGREWKVGVHKGVFQGPYLNEKFKTGKSIYAIELNSSTTLYNNLLCVSALDVKKDIFMHDLQASPNSCYEAGNNRKYKGVGTALMFGIVRIALKTKEKTLQFLNANPDFYKSLKLSSYSEKPEMLNFIKRQQDEWKTLFQKTSSY